MRFYIILFLCFIGVAEVYAQEPVNDRNLGIVFDMEINKPQVIQVADTWQVVMVKEILPAKESTFEEVMTEARSIWTSYLESAETEEEKISHYAGIKYWKQFRPYKRYANMSMNLMNCFMMK